MVGALLTLAGGVLYAGETNPAVPTDGAPVRAGPARVLRCAPPADSPPPGMVGFPLRLTDPAPLAVVHAGQHIDVLAGVGDDAAAPARVVANVIVLRTVRGSDELTGVLYLAVTGVQAGALARLDARHSVVSVTVRAPD